MSRRPRVTESRDIDREYDDSPRFSHDGSRIVFLRIRNGDPELSAVKVVNSDGTGQRQLTPYDMRASQPWSPDDSRIVFNDGGPHHPVRVLTHRAVLRALPD
jgi:Tol biopolymer transport system component